MREICSYGSVGERGGNEPLYPEPGIMDAKQSPTAVRAVNKFVIQSHGL